MDIKQKIENVVSDLITDFLYYDREEDCELGVGAIEKAIENGSISKEEILNMFKQELEGL